MNKSRMLKNLAFMLVVAAPFVSSWFILNMFAFRGYFSFGGEWFIAPIMIAFGIAFWFIGDRIFVTEQKKNLKISNATMDKIIAESLREMAVTLDNVSKNKCDTCPVKDKCKETRETKLINGLKRRLSEFKGSIYEFIESEEKDMLQAVRKAKMLGATEKEVQELYSFWYSILDKVVAEEKKKEIEKKKIKHAEDDVKCVDCHSMPCVCSSENEGTCPKCSSIPCVCNVSAPELEPGITFCKRYDCKKEFKQKRSDQVYCCKNCAQVVSKRNQRKRKKDKQLSNDAMYEATKPKEPGV